MDPELDYGPADVYYAMIQAAQEQMIASLATTGTIAKPAASMANKMLLALWSAMPAVWLTIAISSSLFIADTFQAVTSSP